MEESKQAASCWRGSWELTSDPKVREREREQLDLVWVSEPQSSPCPSEIQTSINEAIPPNPSKTFPQTKEPSIHSYHHSLLERMYDRSKGVTNIILDCNRMRVKYYMLHCCKLMLWAWVLDCNTHMSTIKCWAVL